MLVEIRNLRIQFPTATGLSDAVRNVSLTLGQEKLGIVGESGSGKSLTARSILRLLPSNAVVTAEKLTFDDIDVLRADETALRRIRGARAGLILQDPKFSLNPVMTAGAQIAEAWRVHRGGSRRLADRRRSTCWHRCRFAIRNASRAPIHTSFRAAWDSG